ncbi:MAG: AMP-binding protein [Deltaproteobacteria bacterium]|nr:AMP-binding protein [Deltaproteobacteria bacterium]
MRDRSVGAMVLRRAAESPDDPALRIKDDDKVWKDVPWRDLAPRIENIAAGLMTSLEHLPPRAAITIMGNTSADWICCDFAGLSIGLRTVPVYASLLPDEVGYLHVDTQAVIAIVEDAQQYEKVRAMRGGFEFFGESYPAERVALRRVVVMDPTGLEPGDDWESLADLESRGAEQREATAARRREWLEPLGRDDVCTYTYTSGTTGMPKAAIQTNGNMLSMLEFSSAAGLFVDEIREGGYHLFLPLAHSFGRLIELSGPYFRAPIVVSSIPTLAQDLATSRPGFFPAAPRVFEKIKARIEAGVAAAPMAQQKGFSMALAAGRATIPYRARGEALPITLHTQYALADKLVLSDLRKRLGLDRCAILMSGSAPLSPEVHEFFLSIGVELLEAYGLTETCPGLTSNRPGRFKIGTVGPAMPGIELRIADDAEVLAKGANIVSGYLNRPEATEEAFVDGWFHTGDLGSLDEDGFLTLTGRKKELMKTSGGKFIAPSKIENRLKNHALVQEALIVADGRNYATALLAVDPEELAAWAERTGHAADASSDAVRAELQTHVDAVNATLVRFESIKRFTVVPPMTVESGLLTASLKLKRKVAQERYSGEIEAMYAG